MTKMFVKVVAWWTCLTAFLVVAGLTGCAGQHHFDEGLGHRLDGPRTVERGDHQSTHQGMEDSRTAERVREALAAGADYRYDEVKVTTSSGVVQLNGFVHTSAQRNRAAEAAGKVAGVKGVENNLTVKDRTIRGSKAPCAL